MEAWTVKAGLSEWNELGGFGGRREKARSVFGVGLFLSTYLDHFVL